MAHCGGPVEIGYEAMKQILKRTMFVLVLLLGPAAGALGQGQQQRERDLFNQLLATTGRAYEARDPDVAIATAQEAVTLLRRLSTFPQGFSKFEYEGELNLIIGHSYLQRQQGDKSENVEKAIEALEKANKGLTPNRFPDKYGQMQHSRGIAYIRRAQGDQAQNLKLAVAAFRSALTVYNGQKFASERATVAELLKKTCGFLASERPPVEGCAAR